MVKTPSSKQNQSVSLNSGRLKIEVGTIAMDSSYPTGGEAITFPAFDTAPVTVLIESEDGIILKYDAANKKVMAYWGDNAAAAASALVQVGDTTDLSGITSAAYIAIGF